MPEPAAIEASADARAEAQIQRECADYFNDLIATRYGDSTRTGLLEADERHNVLFKARDGVRVLRPQIVTASTYRRVCRAARGLVRAIVAAADRLAADRALRRAVAFPDYLEELVSVDAAAGGHSLMARFDGFVDPSGRFAMIEYNSAPGGAQVSVEQNLAFARLPVTAAFARRYRFRWNDALNLTFSALGRDHREHGGRGAPTLGFVADTHEFGCAEMRWLAHVAARGCRVMMARPDEFERRGDRLTVDGVPIDVLVFTTWRRVVARAPGIATVLAAIRDRCVRVFHGFSRGLLTGYKNTLELLSDPQYRGWFDRETASVLARHMPWTRVVRDRATTAPDGRTVDLLDFIVREQPRLVLKPSGGREGTGIVLGWASTASDWQRTLARPNYIVQERAAGCAELFPIATGQGIEWRQLTPDCGPYVWNGRAVAGWLARASDTGRHNISGGALNVPVWVVTGRAADAVERR